MLLRVGDLLVQYFQVSLPFHILQKKLQSQVNMFTYKLYLLIVIISFKGSHSFPNPKQIEVEERDTDKPMDATKAVSSIFMKVFG